MSTLDRILGDIKGMAEDEVDEYLEKSKKEYQKIKEEYIANGGKFVTQKDIDEGRTSWSVLDGC